MFEKILGFAVLALLVPWAGWGICFHPRVPMRVYNIWRTATYVVVTTEMVLAIIAFAIWLIAGKT